ncbi:proline-rich transmembrane protein 3 [Dromiciops gliroides]|uniref:proline-rich transmembrane protein 3 n=1 Tax=Dromiciops gliroides TaxID=33562 RepID=UPI001CC42BC3|nr:proline-rich transmembrane protein 3 [Dromiciops gliroides]XP_043834431.1 proline-rich transmembrane protein 3 [Dromiciops gliroides]
MQRKTSPGEQILTMAPTTHISLWSLFLMPTLLPCIVQAGQLPRQPEGSRQSLDKHPTQESQQDPGGSPGPRHQNLNSQDQSWLNHGVQGGLGRELKDWLRPTLPPWFRATVGPGDTERPNSPALPLATSPPLSSVASLGTPPSQDNVTGAVWMGPPPRQEGYSLVDKLGTGDAGGRDVGVKFWVTKGPVSKDRNSEQAPGRVAPIPFAAGSPEGSPTLHLFPTLALGPRTGSPHPKESIVQEKVEVLSKGMSGTTPEGIPREDLGWKVVNRGDDLSLQGPLAAQAPALSWVPSMTTDREPWPRSHSPVIPEADGELIMQTDSVTLRTMNSYVPFPIDHALSPTVGVGEGIPAKAQSWSGKLPTEKRKQGSPSPGSGRSWSGEAQAPQVITEKSSAYPVLRPEMTSSATVTSSQSSRSLPIWISANRLPSVLAEEPDLRTRGWSAHFAHQISTQRVPLSPQTEDSDNVGNTPSATLLPSSLSPSASSPISDTTAPLSSGHQPGPETVFLEGAELIAPQRVRGAVESPSSLNSTTPSTPVPERMTNATKSLPAAAPPGGAASQPRERPPQSHPPAPPASSEPSPTTSRRGLIRVTTQRALGQPNPPEPSPSPEASEPPPDSTCGPRACGPQANETSSPPLRWGPLRHTLSFAWELHVYGAGALFLLLALLALAGLVAAAVTPHVPGRANALAAAALVLAASLLRAVYLLADPYGSRGRLAARTGLVLYNLPFPLLVTALGALALLGLGQLLPARLRSLRLLGALGAVHGTLLLGADLLSPWLRPTLNLLVQGLSCAWGAGVALGTLLLCRRWLLGAVELGPEGQGRSRAPGPGPRVLAVGGALGLLASGLQLAAAVWLYPLAGTPSRFSWPWWGVQFWLRLVELAWAAALALVAGVASCRWGPRPTEHTCWGKLLHYACPPPGKNEVPEYPNNCYDWAGTAGIERGGIDISKSLIRNPAESGAPRPPKDSNELRAGHVFPSPAGSAASLARAGRSPKYPNNMGPGRSRSSVCLDKTAGLSLSELDLRPPSPINLSRSIDEALFREHLVRDSVFLRSSLQYPAGLGRRDSAASLQALPQPGSPLLRQRRSSDPDRSGLTPQDRCCSLTDVRVVPKPAPEPEAGAASGSSLDSFSKGSLKISWNPWRHGLSSVESLPLDELPSTVQLLPSQAEPEPTPAPEEPGDPEREARRSFLALSKQVDSRSASSETIEL